MIETYAVKIRLKKTEDLQDIFVMRTQRRAENTTPKCGEWITVNPIDCMTFVPVLQCLICGNLESGYLIDDNCNYCGSHTKLSKTSSVELNIIKGALENE